MGRLSTRDFWSLGIKILNMLKTKLYVGGFCGYVHWYSLRQICTVVIVLQNLYSIIRACLNFVQKYLNQQRSSSYDKL